MSKKNTIRLTESKLKKIISESVKRVLKETNGLDTDNHAEASYFQIMRLRLSSLSNSSNPEISSRATEILDDIKRSNMTPFECLQTYWDETQELKKSYDLYKNSLDENRIIKKAVRKVLREMEEGSPAEKLLSMGLRDVTGKEGPSGYFNPTEAKPYLLYGEPIFYWTIEVGGRVFCSGDGAVYTDAEEASYACDEYLEAIDGANCGAYAEVESVWLEGDKLETDTMLYFDKYWND